MIDPTYSDPIVQHQVVNLGKIHFLHRNDSGYIIATKVVIGTPEQVQAYLLLLDPNKRLGWYISKTTPIFLDQDVLNTIEELKHQLDILKETSRALSDDMATVQSKLEHYIG